MDPAVLLTASICLGLLLASDPPITEQVVVVKSPRSTGLDLEHRRGERVAMLTLTRPPVDVLTGLPNQMGAHIVGFHRIEHKGDTLRLRLQLSSAALDLVPQRIRHAWVIRALPKQDETIPSKTGLVARIPGLVDLPELPVPVPPEPGDAPCPASVAVSRLDWQTPAPHVEDRTQHIQDPQCAHHLVAALALNTLEADGDLAPFERWAFRFDPRRSWRERPRAFAWVTQIAAEVLLRTGYLPEAEVLLTSPDAFRLPSTRNPRAVSAANLAFIQEDYDAATQLARSIDADAPEDLELAASTVIFLSHLASDRPLEAVREAFQAFERLRRPREHSGVLFAFAAETALSMGRLSEARRLYEFVLKTRPDRASQQARMRLSDLAMRRGDPRRAQQLLAQATGIDACTIAHARLRSVLLGTQSREKLSLTLSQAVKRPACPSERRQATFMLAQLFLDSGLSVKAVPLALSLDQQMPEILRGTGFVVDFKARVLAAAFENLERHGVPAKVVSLFEETLGSPSDLDPKSMLRVGRAYAELGVPEKAALLLKSLMSRRDLEAQREEAAQTLVQAYLAAKDEYRAGLVLTYLEGKFPDSRRAWRTRLSRAAHELLIQRPEQALARLQALKEPSGDPRFEKEWLWARALAALDQNSAAAERLAQALSMPFEPPLPSEAFVVRQLSSALRRKEPEPLWSAVLGRLGPEWPSPRMRFHAERLGLSTKHYEPTPVVETLSAAKARRNKERR